MENGKAVRTNEQQREFMMNCLQPTFLILLHCGWRGSREFWREVEPKKKDGMHGRYYKKLVYFLIILL